MWLDVVVALAAGFLIAAVTTPVGVSGAVFLLPVQVSVLGVPSPAVTPTNLLFNVISVPGALLRYRRHGSLRSELTALLVVGTLPGVVIGAVVRVFVVPDGTVFRGLVALLLLPIGVWLLLRDRAHGRHPQADEPAGQAQPDGSPASGEGHGGTLPARVVMLFGLGAGVVGGIYGIGGGSILAPVLVGVGYAVATVAPAALLSTFLTSCAGVVAYLIIAATGRDAAAPDWPLAISSGIGGLAGGFVGAGLQRRIPPRVLTAGLGGIAVAVAVAYLVGLVAAL